MEVQMRDAGYGGLRRSLTLKTIKAQEWVQRQEWLGGGGGGAGVAVGAFERETGLKFSLDRAQQIQVEAGERLIDAARAIDEASQRLGRVADQMEESSRTPAVEDRRTQIFYGSPNERAQMRSPSGRRDPTTGR